MIYDRNKIDVVMRQAEHGSFSAAMSRLMWSSLRRERFDFTRGLKTYKGKALIVFGWQDPVGSVTFHFIKEAIPHALVIGINECGHMPSQEQPEIFYRTISEFLKESTANNSFKK